MKEDNSVARYYSRFGSWAGYNLVLGRSQHAGHWGVMLEMKNKHSKTFWRSLRNCCIYGPAKGCLMLALVRE